LVANKSTITSPLRKADFHKNKQGYLLTCHFAASDRERRTLVANVLFLVRGTGRDDNKQSLGHRSGRGCRTPDLAQQHVWSAPTFDAIEIA
jgi:hypothetical protein